MPLASEEQDWATLLASLEPWDLHTLMRHELEMHDLYAGGLISREELDLWFLKEQGLVQEVPAWAQ